MRYSFDADPDGPTQKQTQYDEMFGSRGIWHQGWKAVTVHGPTSGMANFDRDRWQLFHTDEDRSEAHDLADQQYTYYPGTTEVPERSAANVHGVSYKLLAEVELTPDAEGVIFAQGSRFGGHALMVKDNQLSYIYNFLGIPPEQVISVSIPTSGKHVVGSSSPRSGWVSIASRSDP